MALSSYLEAEVLAVPSLSPENKGGPVRYIQTACHPECEAAAVRGGCALFTDEGDNHRGRSQDIFCPPWGGGRKSPDHPHVPAVPEAFLGLLTEKFSRAMGGRGERGRAGAPKKPKREKVNLPRCVYGC